MNRNLIISSLAICFSISSIAFAHNGVAHTGKPIEGKASEIVATSFKVKTEAGEKTVEINKDTVFEIGMDGKKGTPQDLKEGSFVMVEGTTLDSGVMVATEVMVHKDSEHSQSEHQKH